MDTLEGIVEASDKDWREYLEGQCRRLRKENLALKSEVDELKNMLREAKYPATVRLEREMKVREKAAIEASRAWSEERGFNHNCLKIEENHGD